MKRRIHTNVWGNTYGYLGTKRTEDFGLDVRAAQHWLDTGESNVKPFDAKAFGEAVAEGVAFVRSMNPQNNE